MANYLRVLAIFAILGITMAAPELDKEKLAVDKLLETPFVKAASELAHSDDKLLDERVSQLLKTPFVLAVERIRAEKEPSEAVKLLLETPLLKAIWDLEVAHGHH